MLQQEGFAKRFAMRNYQTKILIPHGMFVAKRLRVHVGIYNLLVYRHIVSEVMLGANYIQCLVYKLSVITI